MKKIALDKRLIRIIIILTFLFNIYGCAKYRWEFYSADKSTMTCFRGELIKDKAQISLALNVTENRFHIPLIWRQVIAKSPYKIEFAVTTKSIYYDYVLVDSVNLIKESGEVVRVIDKEDMIKLDFIKENYSKFAQGEAYQAHYEFPKKVDIDYLKNKTVTIEVNISLVSKGKSIKREVKAPFYAILEKGTMFIFSTITN